MTYAIIDNRMTADCKSAVSKYADKILALPPHPKLPAPVASHPDMLMWIYEKRIVTYADYRELAEEVFDELEKAGYGIIYSKEAPSSAYPKDVRLNCAVLGKRLLCNHVYVSEEIKKIAADSGLEIIHSRQGYAKCSAVTLSENALITQDPSLYKAAMANGIDALKITEGGVTLKGYDTGFIGGASGVVGDSVLFCGNLVLHPDGERISAFCQTHGKQAISLCASPLYDYGTVFFVEC